MQREDPQGPAHSDMVHIRSAIVAPAASRTDVSAEKNAPVHGSLNRGTEASAGRVVEATVTTSSTPGRGITGAVQRAVASPATPSMHAGAASTTLRHTPPGAAQQVTAPGGIAATGGQGKPMVRTAMHPVNPPAAAVSDSRGTRVTTTSAPAPSSVHPAEVAVKTGFEPLEATNATDREALPVSRMQPVLKTSRTDSIIDPVTATVANASAQSLRAGNGLGLARHGVEAGAPRQSRSTNAELTTAEQTTPDTVAAISSRTAHNPLPTDPGGTKTTVESPAGTAPLDPQTGLAARNYAGQQVAIPAPNNAIGDVAREVKPVGSDPAAPRLSTSVGFAAPTTPQPTDSAASIVSVTRTGALPVAHAEFATGVAGREGQDNLRQFVANGDESWRSSAARPPLSAPRADFSTAWIAAGQTAPSLTQLSASMGSPASSGVQLRETALRVEAPSRLGASEAGGSDAIAQTTVDSRAAGQPGNRASTPTSPAISVVDRWVTSSQRQADATGIVASPVASRPATLANRDGDGTPDLSGHAIAPAAPPFSSTVRSSAGNAPPVHAMQQTDGRNPVDNASASTTGRPEDSHGDAGSLAPAPESAPIQLASPLSPQLTRHDDSALRAPAQAAVSEGSTGSSANPASAAVSQPDADAPASSPQAAAPMPADAANTIVSVIADGRSQAQDGTFSEPGARDRLAMTDIQNSLPQTWPAAINLESGTTTPDAAPHALPAHAWAEAVAVHAATVVPKPLTQPVAQASTGSDKPAPVAASAKQNNEPGPVVVTAPAVRVQPQALPIATALASLASAIPMVPAADNSNAGNRDATSTATPANAGLVSAGGKATSRPAGDLTAPADSAQHSTQSDAQPSLSTSSDAAHATDSAPRPAEASVPPAQTVAVQAAIATAPAAHQNAAAPATTSRAAVQQDAPIPPQADRVETAGAQTINTARLMQTVSETEMHVGMRTAEFGDISIRTTVSEQQLVAQIAVDHGGLGQAISAHISTMQSKLGEDSGLQTSIEVRHMGSSLSGEAGQSSQREQRAFNHAARAEMVPQAAEEMTAAGLGLGGMAAVGDGSRLDIRA